MDRSSTIGRQQKNQVNVPKRYMNICLHPERTRVVRRGAQDDAARLEASPLYLHALSLSGLVRYLALGARTQQVGSLLDALQAGKQ